MQIVGYVIGGIICAVAVFLIVKNTIDIVNAIKQRKLGKKDNKNDNLEKTEENKVS